MAGKQSRYYVTLKKWLANRYSRVVNSIAFFPVITVFIFLIVSWAMLSFDFSETGKQVKAQIKWLSLRDSSTARTIVSTITAGIISLAVFSFSLVMIVLNQAASQLSNRILDMLIGNRFQQFVLGTYIGTITYGLVLLTTIRDIDSGIYIPALSIYLLIFLTVVSIFIFIYFLHHITQSVKFETIIERVHQATLEEILKNPPAGESFIPSLDTQPAIVLGAPSSGYYQAIDAHNLCKLCADEHIVIEMLHPPGSYLLKGTPLLKVFGREDAAGLEENIFAYVDFFYGRQLDRNADYGFLNLTEMAMKALSPGINDPATAVLCLHALTHLMVARLHHPPPNVISDSNHKPRVLYRQRTPEEMFETCVIPIWHYGKNDPFIQKELLFMIKQLELVSKDRTPVAAARKLAADVRKAMELTP